MNKPTNVVIHPVRNYYETTLLAQAGAYLVSKNEHVSLHCIGRLDKDTSGVVVFSKSRIATAKLTRQRQNGQLQKNIWQSQKVFFKNHLARFHYL